MSTLRRFWFTFIDAPPFSSLQLGCGVTAYDYSDAVKLIRERVFKSQSEISIESVVEDIDIGDLEQNHVLPNIGTTVTRGIWFPLGY